jgi:hypothetical protein
LKPVIDRKIPWAFVLGNHDYEHSKDPSKVILFLSQLPLSLTEPGSADLGGTGNYVLKVLSSKGDKVSFIFYMIDSHQNSPFLDKGKNDGNGFISLDQINWYVGQSSEFKKANGGIPIPAFMFFHIPIPEFSQIWDRGKFVGSRLQDDLCQKVNSGLFAAVRSAKDVIGIFVGHNHSSEYVGYLDGIALAHGRKTGLACCGPAPLEKGARVILLREGKPGFDTWIRTESGKQENFVNFPVYFQQADFVLQSYLDSLKKKTVTY